MTAAARAAFISACVLLVGLAAVQLEIENVRSGVRIRDLMIEREGRMEKFRRLEMRFNRMVSPDLLEKKMPEEFRVPVADASKGSPPVHGRSASSRKTVP